METLKKLTEREFLFTLAAFITCLMKVLGHDVDQEQVVTLLSAAGMVLLPISYAISRTLVKGNQIRADAIVEATVLQQEAQISVVPMQSPRSPGKNGNGH